MHIVLAVQNILLHLMDLFIYIHSGISSVTCNSLELNYSCNVELVIELVHIKSVSCIVHFPCNWVILYCT